MSLGRALTAGVVGGIAGSVAMLPLFGGAKWAGITQEMAPYRVVDRAAAVAAQSTEAGGQVEREQRTVAMATSHTLYGVMGGVFYALIQEELELPTIIAGPAFGLAMWAAGYLGWLPATGVLPEPWDQETGDALTPLAANVIYGLTLGVVERQIRG
ncbi:MAG: DUF1440 domain-containing protein [Chloroflexota bacterium]|nr:DUF1440 domain-containing protein [Chloroflexota bacterium]